MQVHRTTGEKPFSLALTRTPPTPILEDDWDFTDTTPTTIDEQKTQILERSKRLMLRAAKLMETQQARQKQYYDRRIRSTPSFKVGEYVFIDNPPSLGKSMADRLADEPRTKLSKKT